MSNGILGERKPERRGKTKIYRVSRAAGYDILCDLASNKASVTHLALGEYDGMRTDSAGELRSSNDHSNDHFKRGTGRKIGDPGVLLLARALTSNTHVRFVRFENINLGVVGCLALRDSLLHNTTVTDLNLSANAIGGGHGFQYIVELLSQNTTLKRLAFARCELVDADVHALREALSATATARESLILSNNKVTEAVGADLAAMLALFRSVNYQNVGKLGDAVRLEIFPPLFFLYAHHCPARR